MSTDANDDAALPNGRHFGQIAHDIRGPAGVVSGALDEVARAMPADSNADVFLEMARRGVRRLLDLADKYSLIDDLVQQPSSELGNCDLTAVVQGAREEVARVYGRRGVTLQVADSPTVMILGDSRSLRVVFRELLKDAVKCARKLVVARVEEDGAVARVHVTVDATLHYPRGGEASAVTQKHELSQRLLSHVARAHGGSVRVDGDGDGGTTTVVTVELERERTRVEHVAPRVLIVDDDQDSTELLQVALNLHGFDASIAHSCAAARQVLAETTQDALIVDMELPDGTGAELVRGLSDKPGAVLMLSGFGRPEDVERSLEAGCDTHLVKPVAVEMLVGTLRDLLEKQAD